MKHADEVREAFADLCREIDRFLQASAHAYPHLVEAIGRVRSAVQAARLPCLRIRTDGAPVALDSHRALP